MLGALLGLAAPAGARGSDAGQRHRAAADDDGRVSVVKVEGLIDPVLADFIDKSISDGERNRVVAVVLQMDSPGAVVSDARLERLMRHAHDADVLVAAWIGPSGSRALRGAAQLAGASGRLGMAPGTRMGKTGDLIAPSLMSPAFLKARDRLHSGTIND